MANSLNYRTIFESVPGLFLVLDRDLKIAAVSNAYLAATMTERERIMGQHIFDVFPDNPNDPAATGVRNLRASFDAVIRSGKPHTMAVQKYDIPRPEERGGGFEERYWSPINSPVFEDGRLAYIIHRVEDITELEEAKLLDRAKDEFIAVISHELRTPMTSILGWTRMLALGDIDDETKREALQALERSTRAQAKLIEDLLDESRISSGKLRLEVRPVDLKSLVSEAVSMARPAAEAKQISVSYQSDEEHLESIADPARLQQVVGNILGNAIKFTPEGGRIRVDLRRENQFAAIRVTDSGQGIEPALLPYVFDRFRQGDQSRERQTGLGLGLAIARHLIELHGGTIDAESTGNGHGASFAIRLPLHDPVISASDFVARDPAARVGAFPRLDGLRVLIVEDQFDNLNVLSLALEQSHAEVRSSTTTAAASAIIDEWLPDVLICDIALPDQDGCVFLRSLRARGLSFPALALTVFGRPDEQARIRNAGFELFRQKPIDPVDLAHEVARLARPNEVVS